MHPWDFTLTLIESHTSKNEYATRTNRSRTGLLETRESKSVTMIPFSATTVTAVIVVL